MSIKVISLSPNPSDGVSWYRCAGPMNRMVKDNPDVEYLELGSHPEGIPWDMLTKGDILFIHRPHLKWQHRVINQAIYMGMKIWIDFDDLLWDIPLQHVTSKMYMTQEALSTMFGLLRNIHPDHVAFSTSTVFLAEKLKEVNPAARVYVIPNAIDEQMFGRAIFASDAKLAAWRGSGTHEHDLITYRYEVQKVLSMYETEFIGYNPQHITYRDVNAICTNPNGLLEFFSYVFRNKKWKCFFVPLEISDFNKSKSNINWIEATMAGAVTVAPNWQEWQVPGVVNYRKNHIWESVHYVMELPMIERFKLWEKSHNYIQEHLTLKVTNQYRYTLLKNLLENGAGKSTPQLNNLVQEQETRGEPIAAVNAGEFDN